jgi:arginine/lysine/ornithine decarboxylase
MDQNQAPLVEALTQVESRPPTGFGAPGHGHGSAMPRGLRSLVGSRAFKADLLTLKGLDDRVESKMALVRAQDLAADAWGADLCRLVTGGSTQSLHTVLAAVAKAGDTILLPQNAHKALWCYALSAGLDAAPLPVQVDHEFDIETVVAPETLEGALAAYPHAKAVVIVSPNYYGITSDVAALSRVAHAHGVPLIVDAAWGGAFAFSPRLPADALSLGADAQVCSIHKTMTALAQGSVFMAKGGVIDLKRLHLAYELFETTSPSVPILASLDATRRDHALRGPKIWDEVLDLAEDARTRIDAIEGLRVWGRDRLPQASELDGSHILVDLSGLGVSGYAADDWLYENHHVAPGLCESRHLLFIIGPGTSSSQIRTLVKALTDLSDKVRSDPSLLPRDADRLPGAGTLSIDRAMPAAEAFFADTEEVAYEEAEGRIAAELIAPSPPAVPRLVPGQRITAAHRDWLVAHRDAGMFVLDPVDQSMHRIRVVRADSPLLDRPLMFAGAASGVS